MSVDVSAQHICLKEFCFVVFWFILRRHPCLHQNIRLTTDISVLMDRRKGAGWREGKGARNGDICNSVNNKNKEKRIRGFFFKYWIILENVKDQTEISLRNLLDPSWVSGESRILMLSHYYSTPEEWSSQEAQQEGYWARCGHYMFPAQNIPCKMFFKKCGQKALHVSRCANFPLIQHKSGQNKQTKMDRHFTSLNCGKE